MVALYYVCGTCGSRLPLWYLKDHKCRPRKGVS